MAKSFIIKSVGVNSKGTPFCTVLWTGEPISDAMLGVISKGQTKSYNICLPNGSDTAAANIGKVWLGFNPDAFDIRPSEYTGTDGKTYTTEWLYPRS